MWLEKDRITSEKLVKAYLHEIHKDNLNGRGLRAIVSLRPEEELLKVAHQMDAERPTKELQGTRGPLYGIPIIVKVSGTQHCCEGYTLRMAGHNQHTKSGT